MLQVDISVAERMGDKFIFTQKLLKEREGTIQLLNKKVDIPATRIIQTIELTKIEKKKEALNTDLINCKARLLKHEEK